MVHDYGMHYHEYNPPHPPPPLRLRPRAAVVYSACMRLSVPSALEQPFCFAFTLECVPVFVFIPCRCCRGSDRRGRGTASRERACHHRGRREPTRTRRPGRKGGASRVHGAGRGDDEALQLQRRQDVSLPEPSLLLRGKQIRGAGPQATCAGRTWREGGGGGGGLVEYLQKTVFWCLACYNVCLLLLACRVL